jgi:hypothetical protein
MKLSKWLVAGAGTLAALLLVGAPAMAETGVVFYIPASDIGVVHPRIEADTEIGACDGFGVYLVPEYAKSNLPSPLPMSFDGKYCNASAGTRWATVYRETRPLTIELSGPSSTQALPAGPVLHVTARVTRAGSPVTGVAIQLQVNGASSGGADSDGNGEYHFTYVPPLLKATQDKLTATCTSCSNTATKLVTVESCDVCSKLALDSN